MIVEYLRYRIETDAPAFEAAWAEAAAILDRDQRCLSYELAHCVEEPALYILRIEWTTLEDHLKGFRRSSAFPQFFKSIGPYVKAIEEMRHYAPTIVRSAAK